MNSTQTLRPDAFFVSVMLPLHRANRRRKVSYLQRSREAETYWGPVRTRTGGLEAIASDAVSAEGTLERLGRMWAAEGDANLVKLTPLLVDLLHALNAPGAAPAKPAQIPDFVYPLF